MGRTGPKNLAGGSPRMKSGPVRASRAKSMSVSPAKAGPRIRGVPPAGGGKGPLKSTSPMARMTGQKNINRPKTGGARGMSINPRADFPSKI